MSFFSRFDLVEASLWNPRFPSLLDADELDGPAALALELLNPNPTPGPFDLLPVFEAAYVYDLMPVPIAAPPPVRRLETELCLKSLSDRVAALELGLERAARGAELDRKYKWTAEIKGAKADRKYKYMVEAKAGEEREYKWTSEIKGKGKDEGKVYMFESWAGKDTEKVKEKGEKEKAKEKGEKEKMEKKKEVKTKKGSDSGVKLVEIEDKNPAAIALRRAFAKHQDKGKRKELSPHDAAVIIQMTFRAHLVHRSQVVRCLRDLAVAKSKLKEIRSLFYNFSYRRRIANDAEEHQRFSEKIIVLLLTVDAIEGPDYMVRAAKKSMVDELEYMLEVVDPQPPEKLNSLRRRRFDLPVGPISKEMARGVAEVVEMLDADESST